MIDNPIYSLGQKVSFLFNGTDKVYGEIYTVDVFGTFRENEEVSYDIMCKKNRTLYKHVKESQIYPV